MLSQNLIHKLSIPISRYPDPDGVNTILFRTVQLKTCEDWVYVFNGVVFVYLNNIHQLLKSLHLTIRQPLQMS